LAFNKFSYEKPYWSPSYQLAEVMVYYKDVGSSSVSKESQLHGSFSFNSISYPYYWPITRS